MSKRLISIILLLAAAALGCPAPEGTTTIERGGSGGREGVGASDTLHVAFLSGRLSIDVLRASGETEHVGEYDVVLSRGDPGDIGQELATTAGLGAIVDAFQGTFDLSLFLFHSVGTGTTAADASDTALETEDLLGNANRCDGSQGENGATTYRTQCTITKQDAGTDAITEAGLFSADATGVLFARQVFAAVNLSQNDSIQTTWDLTIQ
jgi:hypothetical protein